ncbi:MAG: Thioredoxin reductase, partial [Myxococcaceae bacterium]|nr:Thioredoxin reductase [Myxococcaceae bacterium]
DYLVRDLRRRPNLELRLGTEVVEGEGEASLERIVVQDHVRGTRETLPVTMLFALIGAEPHTEWLEGVVRCDRYGFVLTGEGSDPISPETSLPGVFAAGDVRARSVKRVASAVGEGAGAVRYIHEYLREPVAIRPEEPWAQESTPSAGA